jgi:predicted nucleic acid-binding protein
MDWVLEGQVQAVTCPWIVDEYREVVRRAKFRRYGFPPLWLEFLIEESLHLPDPNWSTTRGPDPKDLPFLALAETAGAWLVTGNIRDFPLTGRTSVRVLTPAEFLKQLGS